MKGPAHEYSAEGATYPRLDPKGIARRMHHHIAGETIIGRAFSAHSVSRPFSQGCLLQRAKDRSSELFALGWYSVALSALRDAARRYGMTTQKATE